MERSKAVAVQPDLSGILNDYVLTEILLHLPVKPAVRLQMVSKDFNRLISDPYFARCYTRRHGPPALAGFFKRLSGDRIHLQTIGGGSGGSGGHPPSLPAPDAAFVDSLLDLDDVMSFAICNGLLLAHRSEGVLWVCNVITGASLSLPPRLSPQPWYHAIGLVADETHFVAVFAYKKKTESSSVALEIEELLMDGVVVMPEELPLSWVDHLPTWQSKTDTIQIESFSSKTNLWTTSTFQLPRAICFTPCLKSDLVIDGAVHWSLIDGGLVAYDPKENEVSWIEPLPGIANEKDVFYVQEGSAGSLCCCRWTESRKMEIWKHTKQSKHGKWIMDRTVNLDTIEEKPTQILYLCHQQKAIFMRVKNEIIRLQIDDGKKEQVLTVEHDEEERLECFSSFLVPSWPVALPAIQTNPLPKRMKLGKTARFTIAYQII